MEPTAVQIDQPVEAADVEAPVVADLLVEEVSIDGMCGVY
ncbi:mycofactocin precursor peptide MftA [Frankia sp. AiPs1]|nr:mycofactocin precursor MftA [Frankia sp. AiPa1]MCL9762617.1 mycofactocin precursor MftA [Frankia sp. AiPa1]